MKFYSRFPPCMIAGILSLVAGFSAAEIIADFKAEFSLQTPKDGWNYFWNPTGVKIGDTSGYEPLVPFKDSRSRMQTQSDLLFNKPTLGDAQWLRVQRGGLVCGGSSLQIASDQLSHYAIIAYTIQEGEAGHGMFTSAMAERIKGTGVADLLIYVNEEIIATLDLPEGAHSSFDLSLGELQTGDTVYVAVGSKAEKSSTVGIQFQIDTAP